MIQNTRAKLSPVRFRLDGTKVSADIFSTYAGARCGVVVTDPLNKGRFVAMVDRTIGRGESREEAAHDALSKRYPTYEWLPA